MTPVAMPVIIVLMQFYPGAGTAIPAPKEGAAEHHGHVLDRGNLPKGACLPARS